MVLMGTVEEHCLKQPGAQWPSTLVQAVCKRQGGVEAAKSKGHNEDDLGKMNGARWSFPSAVKRKRLLGPRRGLRGPIPWVCIPFIFACFVFLFLALGVSWKANQRLDEADGGLGCIAWRATQMCTGTAGPREPMQDLPCDTKAYYSSRPVLPSSHFWWHHCGSHVFMPQIRSGERVSGYCECENGVQMTRIGCRRSDGPREFTCRQQCLRLTRPYGLKFGYVPRLSETCGEGADADDSSGAPSHSPLDDDVKFRLRRLWDDIEAALYSSGGLEYPLTPPRDIKQDYVLEGKSLPADDIRAAREKWQRYIVRAPHYGSHSSLFSGEGVVTIGGGLQYFVPAWVMISMLRKSGCALSVEIWFPTEELPSEPAVKELMQDNVTVRDFGQIFPGASRSAFSGYRAKIGAITFSSFERVLWIDADNIPLKDPSYLLQTSAFKETGAVFWRDFWPNTAAPETMRIIGVPESSWPSWAHESGQMVIDKRRGWSGLMLTLLFNLESPLYFRLLSNYMGQGDKETFPAAWMALQLAFHTVQQEPSTIGHESRVAKGVYVTHALGQHDPSGELLFVHNNMNKFGMQLPANLSTVARRWRAISGRNGTWDWRQLSEYAGMDVEMECNMRIKELRCKPWMARYIAIRRRLFGEPQEVDLTARSASSIEGWNGINLAEHSSGRYIPSRAKRRHRRPDF